MHIFIFEVLDGGALLCGVLGKHEIMSRRHYLHGDAAYDYDTTRVRPVANKKYGKVKLRLSLWVRYFEAQQCVLTHI